ncbi:MULTISPECIES: hypothetical protein [unclassified Rhizobium]|uniref:hypothetical protein n=1 Tax=unclassified Rhizobium TaxID=2613769 RepID=UPI00084CD979|nr:MULTISPECIES: hypothetical protein [unclassified Rhizobium]OEC97867.1 hypothetical protein A9Z06_05610 [Rhizobium sp. YK2]QYA14026.1 hypothetical protein J5284_07415 [Rhizobium sp. AB2/73]UEQ80043.1 hypothetical protein I8E17_14585 [Rhizobium sp. AB2/73]
MKYRRIVFGLTFAIAAVAVVNFFYVTWPAYAAKAGDPRNKDVAMVAHLRWGIDPTTVVIDLWNVSSTASMADVDRAMLDIAAALKDRSFTTVQLAYRGITKFQMSGSYFHQLGDERDWQNPLYTIRTMPSNLLDPNGISAFGTWTGGLLGVMGKQMEDHENMHRKWYLDAM